MAYCDIFYSNILQDVERECLNQLNTSLINLLDIYSVLLIYFMATVIQWQIYIENRTDLFALVDTVSLHN